MAASPSLVCPRCSRALRPGARAWRCSARHAWDVRNGILDLGPLEAVPSVDAFDAAYGGVYDWGVNHEAVATLVARLMWASDLGPMYRLMDRAPRLGPDAVILDVAIGGAPVLRRTRTVRATYIGLDLSLGMLRRAATVVADRHLRSVTLVRGDATEMPIASGSVDRVVCFNGLHVISDKAAVIREIARVLRPGGEFDASVLVQPRTTVGRLLRPWTAYPLGFFHPADTTALEGDADAAGFSSWTTTESGALATITARR